MKTNLGKGYTTHNALLLQALDRSSGTVIEMGSGPSSTPLLHWYCKNKGRKLITYDDDPQYYAYAREFQSPLHLVRLVKDWDAIDLIPAGLVFIDHGGKIEPSAEHGTRRGLDAIRWKDVADYVVMHDTEPKVTKLYGYDLAKKKFTYWHDWKECRPWASVASNKHKWL